MTAEAAQAVCNPPGVLRSHAGTQPPLRWKVIQHVARLAT